MAGIFKDGISQIRPGSYFHVSSKSGSKTVGAQDGITAVLFQGTFGPLNEVRELKNSGEAAELYGDGGQADAIDLAFTGGAKKVLAVRIGEGGTAPYVQLGEIATVTARYPGTRSFSVSIKDSLTGENQKTVTFYDGNKEIESYTVEKNKTAEGAALKRKMAGSRYFVAEVGTDGALTDTAQQAFTAGTNPTVNLDSYQAGLDKLERVYCNSVCVGTSDGAIHLLLKTFLDRTYDQGFFGCGVVAGDVENSLEERMAHALSYNDEKLIYVLNAAAMQGAKKLGGYQLAALVAGMYAACPCNKSLTHKVLSGITELTEVLTVSQMCEAEQKGCLVLSRSAKGEVWIDNAVNTLVELPENKDAGWKKIRRTKTRFELMYRMNTTADALAGEVDNDKNGRETVIAKLNEVGASMVQEGKLLSCSVMEDPNQSANTDYAYFLIDVVDKDSLEHLYLYYSFSYDTSEEV